MGISRKGFMFTGTGSNYMHPKRFGSDFHFVYLHYFIILYSKHAKIQFVYSI